MINTERDCRKIASGNISGNTNNAKEIEQKKETFVAALTHDLKTPTIAQIRMLEILLTEACGKLNEEQKEIIELMLKSAKYMLGMISRVLQVYKFENGETKLEYQTFDFKELLLECANELLPLALDRNLQFEVKISAKEKECFISADKIQIRRTIINLISNSIAYAYKNTKIEIALKKEDEKIVFAVSNSGPYIPPETLSTLFDKYVSSKINPGLAIGGTGLGLYITERIISAHKGEIIAQSSKDNINTFGFKIPKAQ